MALVGSAPSREATRRLDIQGLRAFAVMVVVAFHAGLPVPGGFTGVDVFFVISGFVIAGMLRREWRQTGTIGFTRFYLCRFRRLTPALAVMVAVTVLLTAVFLSPLGVQQTAATTGIGAMLLVANVVIARKTGGYFDANADTNPLLHTWSLSVEEQFYLVFPAVIALGWYLAARNRTWRHTPTVLVGAIAAFSLLLACFGTGFLTSTAVGRSVIMGPYGKWLESAIGFYSPLTRWWEFAAGVLLALGISGRSITSARIPAALGAVGTVLLLVSLWAISGQTPFPSLWTLIPVTGALLILAAGSLGGNPVSRTLATPLAARIGDWSYSIYLWHWPFIVIAGAIFPDRRIVLPIAAAVSFIPAVASYRWIESPIRSNAGFSRGWPATRLVVATLTVPVVISALVITGAGRGYGSHGIQAVQAAVLSPHLATQGLHCDRDARRAGDSSPCVYNSGATGRPIYMVGDSTAWHFSEAASDAGAILGRPVKILLTTGCPFKDVYFIWKNGEVNGDLCRERYVSAMTWLTEGAPGTVIISDLNLAYGWDTAAFGLRPDALTDDPQRRVGILRTALLATVRDLERAGQSVVLVQAAPEFEAPHLFDPLRCSLGDLRADACVTRMSRADADAMQSVKREAIRAVAATTGASVWDPRDLFCAGDDCSTQEGGVDLYRDSKHISPRASHLLAPSLAQTLAAAG